MRTLFIASAVLALVAPSAQAQSDERQKIDTTFSFAKDGVINLGQVSGDISVTGWSKGEVKIFATIETGYLETSLSSSHIRLQARSRRNRMGQSRYELSVPVGVEVHASTVSGDVMIRGTGGEVTVNSVSGDVEVRDATRTEISTVSGNVRGEKLRGRVRSNAVSGDMTLDDVVGEFRGRSVSGDVQLRGTLTGMEFESVSGGFTFSGDVKGDGMFSANTHSGDLRVTLPANQGANLELQTFSGELRSEFPLTLQPGEQRGPRNRRLRTAINGGGPRLSLETFSGDLVIEKSASRTPKED